MHLFTINDLVEYLYNETYPEKTAAIQDALASDFKLRERYEVLLKAYKRLKDLHLFSPESRSVDAIIAYALSVQK